MGALVPQPHGGALRNGGTNEGGPGRPPSAIRELLRGDFSDRRETLKSIADGEAVQKGEIPLGTVLRFARCPKCGDRLEKLEEEVSDGEVVLVKLEGKVSASVGDRIKALDVMAKYGLGALKEVSVEHVRDRLRQTIDIIRQEAPELAEALLAKLEPVWR